MVQALRELLARVVVLREAIADGDSAYAFALAADLEDDLAAAVVAEAGQE